MPSPESEGKPVFLDTKVFVYAATHPEGSLPEARPTVEATWRIVQALGERRNPAATYLVVLMVSADQGFPQMPGLTVLSPEALAQSLND